MGLAECISSAAGRVRTHDNESEAEREEDEFADMGPLEFNSESFSQSDIIVLLDALRFIIECSKQHFNPNYRLRGLKITKLVGLYCFHLNFNMHMQYFKSLIFFFFFSNNDSSLCESPSDWCFCCVYM